VNMRQQASSFWEFLDDPLRGRARLLLVALVVPLLLSFAFPLWRISMRAPQYPQGLYMDIYSYRLVGGNDGHDVQEINNLNHYIGMHQITQEELRDLDWMPFGLVALALLALRAALLGNVRTLIDLSIVAAYISLIAFGRFVWMLWEFGHDLDPKAPFKVAPFMPVVLGSKQIANFSTRSMPQTGSVLLGAFTFGVWALTLFYLWRGRRDARAVMTTNPGALACTTTA
jgi:copper chaperone NosL